MARIPTLVHGETHVTPQSLDPLRYHSGTSSSLVPDCENLRQFSEYLWMFAKWFCFQHGGCPKIAVWYILIAENDDKSWSFLGSQFWVNPRWFKMTWNVWASRSFPPFPLLWQRFFSSSSQAVLLALSIVSFFFSVSVPLFVYFGLSWFVRSFFSRKSHSSSWNVGKPSILTHSYQTWVISLLFYPIISREDGWNYFHVNNTWQCMTIHDNAWQYMTIHDKTWQYWPFCMVNVPRVDDFWWVSLHFWLVLCCVLRQTSYPYMQSKVSGLTLSERQAVGVPQ